MAKPITEIQVQIKKNNRSFPKVVVITTYEPDPAEWIDAQIRR